MQKIGIILCLASTIVQICYCEQSPSVDTMNVDELVSYYLDNGVYYFYPKAPLIKSELEAILHLVDESGLKNAISSHVKAKTYQYIREYIVEILLNLKRRDQGCNIHSVFITAMHAIRHLIDDTGDRELFVEVEKHALLIDEAIDWKHYYRNSEAALREVQTACKYNGFEMEYAEKLAIKSC